MSGTNYINLGDNLENEKKLLEKTTEKHSRPVHCEIGGSINMPYDMLDMFDVAATLGIDLFGKEKIEISENFNEHYKVSFIVEPIFPTEENCSDFGEWTLMNSHEETKYKILEYISAPVNGVTGYLSFKKNKNSIDEKQSAYISLVTKLMMYPANHNWIPAKPLEYAIRYDGCVYGVSLKYEKIHSSVTEKKPSSNNVLWDGEYDSYGREKTYKPRELESFCQIENEKVVFKFAKKFFARLILGYCLFTLFMTIMIERRLSELPYPEISSSVEHNLHVKQKHAFAEIYFRKTGEFPPDFNEKSTMYKYASDQRLIDHMTVLKETISNINSRIEYADSVVKMETPTEISRKIDLANKQIADSENLEFREYLNKMTLEELELYLEILKENSKDF